MTKVESAPAGRSRRRWLLVGAAALGGVFAGLWLFRSVWWTQPRIPPPAAERTTADRTPDAVAAPRDAAAARVPQLATPAPTYDGRLRPSDVLGNLGCSMASGRGAAAGTALVVLPHGPGAMFTVVDGEGAVFGAEVPFRPNHLQLGRREDGTPLVGLGALRLGSKHFRPPDSPEPVRVYLGRQLIYESDKAWDFRVARDASSFVVHEPIGAGGSRLVVRDLELGQERHVDLGTRMTPTNAYEYSHAMDYTLDGTEVVFQPAHADAWGKGAHYFYPIGEGRSQRVTVEGGLAALLVSSSEGYFVDPPESRARGVWRITKRRLDARAGTTEDVWKSTLDLTEFFGRLSISDDGRYLGVHGWDFQVLDTETGRTLFEYPTVGQKDRRLAMLASVLGEDPSPADLGDLTDITFRDGNMLFFRQFGSHDCSTPPGEEYDDVRYRECVRDHREKGRYRTVFDAYDLATLAPDSQPMYRAEVYRETNCMAGDMPFRGLQDVGGTLTYLTEVR